MSKILAKYSKRDINFYPNLLDNRSKVGPVWHGELCSMLCGGLNEKEIQGRGGICIHLPDHFAVQHKPTQHCKATTLQQKYK